MYITGVTGSHSVDRTKPTRMDEQKKEDYKATVAADDNQKQEIKEREKTREQEVEAANLPYLGQNIDLKF